MQSRSLAVLLLLSRAMREITALFDFRSRVSAVEIPVQGRGHGVGTE